MNISGKTVLVVGATGLLGGCLVDTLMLRQDVFVIAMSRNLKKLNERFDGYIARKNFKIMAHDITNPLKLSRRIDFIFNAAGDVGGAAIRETPVDVISTNILGTINCLNFLKKQQRTRNCNGRIICFSSATVYKNYGDKDVVMSEEDTICTESLDALAACYLESKRMMEVLVRAYNKQYGVDVVIARLGYVYGYSKFNSEISFYQFIKMALDGIDIEIKDSRSERRDYIYVNDAVSGLLTIAEKGIAGESYNISTCGALGNFVAIDELAVLISKSVKDLSNICVEVNCNKGDGKRKPGIILYNSKLKALGWSPYYDLHRGIFETILNYIREKTL